MATEELVNVTNVPVTVDPKTAEDRGDNFTPTDDPLPLDNDGNSIDTADLSADALQALVDGAEKDGTPAAPAPAAATTAAADEGEEVARQNGGQIPKGRFNEVNNARKTAEARAAELLAENERLRAASTAAAAPAAAAPTAAPAAAAPAFDMLAQERAYTEALLDGDTDKALKIRGEINDHILTTAEQRASTRIRGELTAEQQASALQEATDAALVAYPYLDTAEGATALRIVVATRDAYIADGLKPHLALNKAVAEVAPRFAPAPATPSRESTAAAPATDTRTANALSRGAADSNLQPPAIVNGIGNRATQGRIDVTTMTEAQFEALPDAEKKKLRGD
ncbi:hypothetical protein GmRootV59_13110 [Variovorax sp. V59]|uniref:hypothetical protein n=1 Tax=unclassified Variovorax TaxID=663243 RepID=UPI0034E8E510